LLVVVLVRLAVLVALIAALVHLGKVTQAVRQIFTALLTTAMAAVAVLAAQVLLVVGEVLPARVVLAVLDLHIL
jgi:hypothetical protein